jgi:alpha amylase-like protein
MSTMTADWPADAVLDEIYPQSFADSDGDGVGDLRGVIEHLDHLGWLGVDTIWFNPLLDSPFVDAGYDVADYLLRPEKVDRHLGADLGKRRRASPGRVSNDEIMVARPRWSWESRP